MELSDLDIPDQIYHILRAENSQRLVLRVEENVYTDSIANVKRKLKNALWHKLFWIEQFVRVTSINNVGKLIAYRDCHGLPNII